jgi:hypothetical protein
MEKQNEIIPYDAGEAMLRDLQNTQKMCEALKQTPHYKKLGDEGILAVVAQAKALKIDPLLALNGSLYHIQGKVEMTAHLMAQLIRQAGHSITKDKKSDNTICILHGKRHDTGDTWCESFSMEDANRAGVIKPGGPWHKFPRNMLYARALSNLARQLFPDVIKGCYVEGEISQAPPINQPIVEVESEKAIEEKDAVSLPIITAEQYDEINDLIGEDEAYRKKLEGFILKNFKAASLQELPAHLYSKVKERALHNQKSKELDDVTNVVEEKLA